MNDNNLMQELPMGFAMALARHPNSMTVFSALSPDRRQQVIFRARHVSSREEMEELAASLAVPGTGA